MCAILSSCLSLFLLRTVSRPEDGIPLSTSKPPKPPRLHYYGSEDASLDSLHRPQAKSSSLRQSLEEFTSHTQTSNSFHKKYGSAQSLTNAGVDDSQTGYFSRVKYPENNALLERINSYQKKYGSLQSLDNGGLFSQDEDTTPNNGASKFCSQCGDHLSPVARRRAQCGVCHQWICKLCAVWEPKFGGYICEAHEAEPGFE